MNQKVIDTLNAARAAELTAIMQYMADHYVQEDDDFTKLAHEFKKIAIVEMKHAEALAERILYLGGTPTTKPDGVVVQGQSIHDALATAAALERGAIEMYNIAASTCEAEGDHVSKELMQEIAAAEEAHWDFFDNTQTHVDELGAAYIATLTGSKV